MRVFHFLLIPIFRNELRNWNARIVKHCLDNFANRFFQISMSLVDTRKKPVDTEERRKEQSTSRNINRYTNGLTADTETEAKRVSWWGKPCHRGATRRRGTCPVFRRGSNVTIGKYKGGNGNGVSRFARAYFYVSPGSHRRLFLFSFLLYPPLTRALTHDRDFQRPFGCLSTVAVSHSVSVFLSFSLSCFRTLARLF